MKKYISIIKNKKANGHTVKQKNDALKIVSTELNANNDSEIRSVPQLKHFKQEINMKK